MIRCLFTVLMHAVDVISLLFQLQLVIHVVDTSIRHAGLVVILFLFPLLIDNISNRCMAGKCRCISDIKFTTKTCLPFGLAYVVQAINKPYLRKSALLKFAKDRLKPEIIGAGITDYLLEGKLMIFTCDCSYQKFGQNIVRLNTIFMTYPTPIQNPYICLVLHFIIIYFPSCVLTPLWYVRYPCCHYNI